MKSKFIFKVRIILKNLHIFPFQNFPYPTQIYLSTEKYHSAINFILKFISSITLFRIESEANFLCQTPSGLWCANRSVRNRRTPKRQHDSAKKGHQTQLACKTIWPKLFCYNFSVFFLVFLFLPFSFLSFFISEREWQWKRAWHNGGHYKSFYHTFSIMISFGLLIGELTKDEQGTLSLKFFTLGPRLQKKLAYMNGNK